ncbi:MAG: GGDEF domain-containing protein, partial [Deltaproteobacteria bacterium]|nr:GGDEF domain-containing protein [Deltaproteobacteria bacterium]
MEKFIEEIRDNAEKKGVYLDAIRALLLFIKDFSMDFEETGSDRFVKQIDDLSERFVREKKTKTVETIFESHKKSIPAFIRGQKEYLNNREKELWDIIGLQRTAITTLGTENQVYNRKVYERSKELESITMLDDIKIMKKNLKKEVETIQTTVRKKEEQDKQQMGALARQISSLSIELRKVKTKAMTDGLTKAYNRGAFDAYIRKIVDRNTIKRTPFSLLMLDIDDFKKINDAYGHQIGDRVLVALVKKCTEFIRDEDFLARYGGEEFVIVLPGASLRNALKKAQRLRKAIAGTHYTTDKEKGKKGLSITVSIGASSFCKNDSVSTVIDRSDQALYQAKRTGKNRVVSEEDIES